ncbi:hypothetical protein ESA_01720 [Cronobacter sakazakii ATCC BAA-894]|uniref:Uncharacterized protein n=1 Tax=Cronobacter sakazakii (strain ATCC BAA-894) TaxID=290339 RepID=A7MLE7_CROS8|nr:hypothetical protein ESA_01720 [Cronobacter sakazakii ATCC BAA-894]
MRQRYILHAFYKTSPVNAIAFPARKNLLRLMGSLWQGNSDE